MKTNGLSLAQILSLKKDIQQQLEQLRHDMQTEQEDQRVALTLVDSSEVCDRSEAAASTISNFASLTHISHLSQEIRECEHTLKRIDEGDYGFCEGCGDEVELNRLMAYPTATFCVACQFKEEQGRSANKVASF
ncbi:MAG: TraR/DksA family transcriptional regulator [Amphritea sp.]